MLRAPSLAPLSLALVLAACETAQPQPDDTAPHAPATLPGWLKAPNSVARDAALEETAALLCARDTDGVIDTDARHATGLADGQVFGLLRKGPDARETLAKDAAPLLANARATVAGAVEGVSPDGRACTALVAARRLVSLSAPLVPRLPVGAAQTLAVHVHAPEATLYVQKPDGFVTKMPVAAGTSTLSVPAKGGEGRYVLELIVDDPAHRDPEVALLWPYLVGAPKEAPFPEVLFPDEGHSDIALTHRAEALVQRLRNEQLIEPFKVSPLLIEIAAERATGIATGGRVGHRVPAGKDVVSVVAARFPDDPRARFARLAEVQAQASTLADAWQALLDSPAHRYELVDTGYTHVGVAVARGADAAGRPTVSLVALLARRAPSREVGVVRGQIADVVNAARDQRGLEALVPSAHLDRVAMRLAERMKETGKVDEALLGAPVGQVALEADASLSEVKPLIARLDDPLLLLQPHAPELLLDLDKKQLGFGMATDDKAGVFFVVVLAGE
jgi:uncharacterized protein YkwD